MPDWNIGAALEGEAEQLSGGVERRRDDLTSCR